MKPFRTVALGVAAGALALPAAALAHPGVYTSKQLAYEAAAPYNDACRITDAVDNDLCIQDRQRTTYAVGNDGYAMAFTEGAPAATPSTLTNGAPAGRGLVNYRFLPGTWRGAANDDNRKLWMTYVPAKTDLQAHATCLGAAWDTPDNILAWQDDPFYNYIPWQKASVGIGDEPAKWIDVVKVATGVDLAALNTPAEFKAACETFPSATYYPADTASNITSATVRDAVAPLNTQLETLQGQVSTLQSQVDQLTNQIGVLEAAKTAAEAAAKVAAETQVNAAAGTTAALAVAQKAATDAEAARQALLNRPLLASLSAKKFEQGVAMVTGKAGADVKVTMTLAGKDAKKLKISQTIASRSAKLDAQGAGLFNLNLTSKARKAIDKHLPALKVTITAVSGAESSDASGTLTR